MKYRHLTTLFQPLQIQKNYRELEIIVQECILNTLRESVPVEAILKAYMDESVEEDVIEEIKEEITHEPIHEKVSEEGGSREKGISFNDIDYIKTNDGIEQINAPKNVERLEEISAMRNEQRKREEENNDSNNSKLTISEQSLSLNDLDIQNIEEPKMDLFPDLLIDEIEVLE
jgi:PBP1b-binding outer membrane lipoprotein LpoB